MLQFFPDLKLCTAIQVLGTYNSHGNVLATMTDHIKDIECVMHTLQGDPDGHMMPYDRKHVMIDNNHIAYGHMSFV